MSWALIHCAPPLGYSESLLIFQKNLSHGNSFQGSKTKCSLFIHTNPTHVFTTKWITILQISRSNNPSKQWCIGPVQVSLRSVQAVQVRVSPYRPCIGPVQCTLTKGQVTFCQYWTGTDFVQKSVKYSLYRPCTGPIDKYKFQPPGG